MDDWIFSIFKLTIASPSKLEESEQPWSNFHKKKKKRQICAVFRVVQGVL